MTSPKSGQGSRASGCSVLGVRYGGGRQMDEKEPPDNFNPEAEDAELVRDGAILLLPCGCLIGVFATIAFLIFLRTLH